MHLPRIAFIGALYHITVRCNNREFFFQEEKDFETYLDILLKTKKIYKVKVHAYCITSNHVHLMLSTPEENTLSSFRQYLNGNYSKAYNKVHCKSGRFWGGRFYSTIIESETQFFNTLVYIELNMARAKAVEEPKDWKWSSYHAHAFGQQDRVLDFHPLYNEMAEIPWNDKKTIAIWFTDRWKKKAFYLTILLLAALFLAQSLLLLLSFISFKGNILFIPIANSLPASTMPFVLTALPLTPLYDLEML